MIPSDYCVVMNTSEETVPQGSFLFQSRFRGYLCIKRSLSHCAFIHRAFGRSCICDLKFIPKSKKNVAMESGYFLVKQYPECQIVDFSNAGSSEEVYLG